MKGKQVLPIPKRVTKACTHVHYSGRRCAQRIKPAADFCGLHKAYRLDGSTVCAECDDMLRAFPIRKRAEEGEADGIV